MAAARGLPTTASAHRTMGWQADASAAAAAACCCWCFVWQPCSCGSCCRCRIVAASCSQSVGDLTAVTAAAASACLPHTGTRSRVDGLVYWSSEHSKPQRTEHNWQHLGYTGAVLTTWWRRHVIAAHMPVYVWLHAVCKMCMEIALPEHWELHQSLVT